MNVGGHGESGRRVPQPVSNGAGVYASGSQLRPVGVAQVMGSDSRQPKPLQPWVHIAPSDVVLVQRLPGR